MFVPLTPLEFRERAVKYYGKKVGVVDVPKRFTYLEFDERINRQANALKLLGVRPGDVVSYVNLNTHHLLEAYYAVPQIGAILNPINIRLAPAEIAYILNHAGTKVLVFHSMFLPLVEKLREQVPGVQHYIIIEPNGEWPEWAHEFEALLSEASPDYDVDLDAIDENTVCELFYTSGTTGPPKGVTLTHRTLYLHALNAIGALSLRDTDTLLHIVPLFHVNGWGTPQFLTAVGGKHVMLRKVDPTLILQLAQDEKVTRLFGVPTVFNAMVNHPDVKKYDLSHLKEIIIGGAPAPAALLAKLEDLFGVKAFSGYGLTETSPILTLAYVKDYLDTDVETRRYYEARTGIPVVGVRLRVVDNEGRDVAWNNQDIGEIIVRSNVVMEGYLKDPDATAEAIKDGWFHTGDMAVVDEEGYVLIVDRKKDIIISGGENISSVEVENALYAHPAVYECAVIGVPDEKWGEVPLALVVLKPGMSATEEELIQFLRDRIAHYKVPKRIEFRSELPKGGTGKILKRELREPYWRGYEKRVHG